MILAALIDAGAEFQAVRKQIARLNLPLSIDTEEVKRGGFRALRLVFPMPLPEVGGYEAATRIVVEAGLDPEVEGPAMEVLSLLASAESSVHGGEPHFHEIDAADTLVDIVGVAAAIAQLGIERVSVSPIGTGQGTVATQHGEIPLPAPAVLELLRSAPIFGRPVDGELITPTGAAILARWATSFGPMPGMRIQKTGYGAGSKEMTIPNFVRAVIGEPLDKTTEHTGAVLVEANIDDMNPEFYEYVIEKLFEAGASDAWLVPAIGKRGRPVQVLTVLASESVEAAVREIVLSETSTLGLRTTPVVKWMLDRTTIEVRVRGHAIRVKVATRGDSVTNVAPEYSDCHEAARQSGATLKDIFREATAEAIKELRLDPAIESGRERS